MTIVAAVKSRDGLVLGTDSMTQVIQSGQGGTAPQILKAYKNATKLFQLGSYNIGVATWGMGNIDTRSIGGIVHDFSDTLAAVPPKTIEAVANELATFAGAVYDKALANVPLNNRPVLGFFVGGYPAGQPLPELWEVRFPSIVGQPAKRVAVARGQNDFGAAWRGIEVPFVRQFFGMDPRMTDELVRLGIKLPDLQRLTQNYQMSVIFDSMPLQDAVDFASFVMRTTIGCATFEVGVASCGEPLQIAVFTRRDGMKWVAQPTFHV